MKKQNNKEFKINIINLYKSGKSVKLLSKKYNVSWQTIYLWIKTYNAKGKESLELGHGTQIKSEIRKRGVVNKPLELMTKKEIYEYAKQFEELSKYLSLNVKNKYKKIYELSNIYTIVSLCKIFKVSRTGYYKWLCLGKPKYNKWNNLIADIIQTTYHNFKKIYGYNMITLWLKKLYDLELNPWVVYRYMKQMKLKAIIRKKRFNYKKLSGQLRYENILNRNFSTTGINQKIGTDITYLTTNNKTYYLSIVKDFHTNEILDYQISKTLDMPFVVKNIINAWVKAGKPKTWILQTDQGFHYTNFIFTNLCKKLGIIISMSRRGSSPDNGHTESWFGTFKTEFFETLKRIFRNKEYIYRMIPQYIKFYNEIRPQRKLKGLSPVEYRITQS